MNLQKDKVREIFIEGNESQGEWASWDWLPLLLRVMNLKRNELHEIGYYYYWEWWISRRIRFARFLLRVMNLKGNELHDIGYHYYWEWWISRGMSFMRLDTIIIESDESQEEWASWDWLPLLLRVMNLQKDEVQLWDLCEEIFPEAFRKWAITLLSLCGVRSSILHRLS